MGDPVTQGMFFEAMAQMRQDFETRHRHVREDIHAGFEKISDKLDQHAADDRAVEKRVTLMEAAVDFKKEEARKAAAVTSLGISGLVIVAVEALKHAVGWSK